MIERAEWAAPPLAELADGDSAPSPADPRRRTDGRMSPGSLPAQLTPLVRRVDELQQIVELLQGPTRLVTLTGPGGVGKTRLALAVAEVLAERTATPVCVVELAAVHDPLLVSGAVATELGLREPIGGGVGGIDGVLVDFLRARQLLLVLDNLEHLLSSATFVVELLRAAPGVRVLATSRASLRVEGDHEVRVPPLSLPACGDGHARVVASPAVALFVQRARAANANFRYGADEVQLLEGITRRVDGLPLAIELEAARVRNMPLRVLFDRLANSLDVLNRGPRNAPARQRTLRATLDWSYQLLEPCQQQLFEQLSVFPRGCSLEAAQAVCPTAAEVALEEALFDLVEGRLLEVAYHSDQPLSPPRFRMLEIVREYALARLAVSDAAELTARRLVNWCLGMVQGTMPRPPDPRTVALLLPEVDNMRAALRCAIDDGAVADGLSLALALWMPWYVAGAYTEGRACFSELLAQPGADAATPAWASARFAAGMLAHCQGDYAASERLLERAGELADHLGLEVLRGAVFNQLANVARARGETEQAVALYESARGIFSAIGDHEWEALVLTTMADAFCQQGQLRRAATCAQTSLDYCQHHPNSWLEARTRYVIGRIAAQRGHHARMRSCVESGLALERELGDQQGIARSLLVLGHDAARRGEACAAERCFTESLSLAEQTGDRLMLARNLEGLA